MNALTEGALIGIERQTAIEAQRRQQNQVIHAQACRAKVTAGAGVKLTKVRR